MTDTTNTTALGTEAAATEEKKKKSKLRSPMHYPQMFLLHALVIILVVWGLFGVVFGVMSAPNNDMYPRFDSGDLLLYYRLDRDVKAQDTIVLDKNDTTYVGRVVAVGGDTVDITDDERLIVNDNAVVETNIFYPTPRYEGFMNYPVTVPEGECFVLVDSRESGEDSRYYGTVSMDEIEGTVITVLRRSNL